MKRASALIFALWTIAVLSIMALAFAYEARQHMGINLYVQERNRVAHLIDAGKILAEVVLTSYKDVADWSEEQNDEIDKLLEEDVWFLEKQALKSSSKCTIGPVFLDEDNPESSLITVEIETANSGEDGVININELYSGSGESGDSKYMERWWMIFQIHGIPEELDTPKDGRINLWNVLIASWNDWRDSDDSVTTIDGEECGAENEWYEEEEEELEGKAEEIDELRRRPRQGPIPDIKELQYVRGFRDYPAVLTGGVINPWEEDEKNQITVKGIMGLFSTDGSNKININTVKSVEALMTIPGIYDDPSNDPEECELEAREVAEAIMAAMKEKPEDREVDETLTSWPFRDWDDMIRRLDDSNSMVDSSDIGSDAKNYITFSPGENSVFKIKITAESMGMSRSVTAEGYVNDKTIRYVKWSEQ